MKQNIFECLEISIDSKGYRKDTYKQFNMHYKDGHSLQSKSLVHHTKYLNMVAFKSLVKSDS
ncbi:hypothetical protein SLEP1_g55607 [Rubroshorea leprosula]|uniref:LAGLIDADG homing endonuclease n=1 Tax=Rubroshorea leprosula TaxID=152421 RepID=A0AAV5MG88_9ROSI|nr:hypothetical protein SLEP1_g55607 [Rubroshorea leprosula]